MGKNDTHSILFANTVIMWKLLTMTVSLLFCLGPRPASTLDDRPPVMGRLPFDPIDWAKKRPDQWLTEVRPTAHFKKVGVVSQSVGYAHITFRMDMKPLQEEMTDLCSILEHLADKSTIHHGNVSETMKTVILSRGNTPAMIQRYQDALAYTEEWTLLKTHCENIMEDYRNMGNMWASNIRSVFEDQGRRKRGTEMRHPPLAPLTWWEAILYAFSPITSWRRAAYNIETLAELRESQTARSQPTTTEDPEEAQIMDLFPEMIDDPWMGNQRTGTRSENTTGQHRNKRQVLIIAALVMSFASLLYSATDLFKLSSNREDTDIVHHIHDDEVQVAVNKRSIQILNTTLVEMVMSYKVLAGEITQGRAFVRAQTQVFVLFDKWSKLVEGLEMLSLHKLSPRLINVNLIRKAINDISRRTQSYDYALDIKELEDVFSFPVSHLAYANQTIQVFLHIPIKRVGHPFEIYKFIPSPINLETGTFAFPIMDREYLIMDRSATTFRSLSSLAFSLCKATGTVLSCPDEGMYHSVNRPDCLLALFLSKWESIRSLCKWDFNEHSDHYSQVSGNDYLIYFSERQGIELTCAKERWNQDFKGLKRVVVPPGCIATAKDVVMYGRVDILVEESTVYKREFSIGQLLDSKIAGELNFTEVIGQLGLVGSSAGISIPTIELQYTGFWWGIFKQRVVTIAISSLIFGVVILCFCRGKHNIMKRLRTNYPVYVPQAATAPDLEGVQMSMLGKPQ